MGWLKRSLRWLQGGTLKLLFLGGGTLLVWGVFAPIGTLTWWLSQSSGQLGFKPEQQPSNDRALVKKPQGATIDCYIIYFPGVGDYSANQLTPGEEFFLSHLTQQHPNCVAVSDVFPYSASNQSLGGQRLLAPFWTAIDQTNGPLQKLNALIKIRNLWRFAISADDRYSPIYSQGIALAVRDRMNAMHPIPDPGKQPIKLILVGTSGGAQVALGAAPYLKEWLNPQILMVSLGGDFQGTAGFNVTEHVYHLQGDRDWVEDLSGWVFPSRWRIVVGSPFNQARLQGRYTEQTIGPHEHDGDQGYFGLAPVGNSKTTYVDLTLQQVNQLPIWSAPPARKSTLPGQTHKK